MRIFCDFDGTVTRQDSTDFVLEALADSKWRALQAEWEAGRLSGASCMRDQIALIGGSAADLDAVLDTVELDPGFTAFVAWCEDHGFPLSLVSDGVDRFIDRILSRHELQRLPVVANQFGGEPGAWRLTHPTKPADCVSGSGVCKCAAVAPRSQEPVIFIGDGRSDFCVSTRVDVLFAKGSLAEHAKSTGNTYIPFDTFHDVRRALAQLVGARPAMLRDAPCA